ncbi:MAG: N-acetylmuramoyl-L-alanine amidase, partial [Deltaproteobacteria bacterium]
LANDRKADFFISIHANASDTRRVRGIETYYLKNTDDRATLRLASLENGVDMILRDGDASADADLPYIISDLAQGHKEQESLRLARHVQSELVRHLRTRYSGVDSLGDKQGPFLVLDGTHMPSILVEIGFLTHEVEGARLGSPAYREAVAEGLYRGLRSYLAEDLGRAQP